MSKNDNLVEVRNLKKYFHLSQGKVLKAVDGVSFAIRKGETLGLVGESGCGKSTTGRTVIKIYDPTDGSIFFDGKDITRNNHREYKQFTREAQIIFQDPYASLDSRMTTGEIIGEGIEVHNLLPKRERTARIHELLNIVGLNKEHINRFPHEFSGGQRQRIGIARALAIEPKFIVCDEPISALDVSIQAQVVNLLMKLQREFGLTYLFIAHDLSMIKHISDKVAVMYLGSIVEITLSQELYKNPLHPYTQSLLSAIPIADPVVSRSRQRILLEGDVPSPIDTPPGCKFRNRCRYAEKVCGEIQPELKEVEDGHFVACHVVEREM
ncbi:MAG: ABC transporter ATP-binding protein [Sediminispirochaetaceae bacterium]